MDPSVRITPHNVADFPRCQSLYEFSGHPTVRLTAHSGGLIPKRSHADWADARQNLHDRYKKTHDSIQLHLSQGNSSISTPHTSGQARAMLWHAQAIAHSPDRPGWLIANHYDKLFRALMLNPEAGSQYGIKPELSARLKADRSSHPLSSEDRLQLSQAIASYHDQLWSEVKVNRKLLRNVPPPL